MDAVAALFDIDYGFLFLSLFLVITGVRTFLSAVDWLLTRCGIEFKWMKRRHEDHSLLLDTVSRLEKLEQQRHIDVKESISHDRAIRTDLAKLTEMFIDKEIDDMRWEIINFSTKIAEGKPCNKDGYKHCLRTYEKYQKILKENDMTNGEVEISIDIITESYKKMLNNGFVI